MSFEVKIILDSITKHGHRLTTMQVTFPRFILAEVNTHRMFSRNSASSRAIPVQKRIEQIEAEPFVPIAFGKNQRGMQASEALDVYEAAEAEVVWRQAAHLAVEKGRRLAEIGVHKQWANRVIETYAWHTAVISATEWSNHEGLRCHPAASPEYQTIAKMMRDAKNASTPCLLGAGEWHLPYVMDQDGNVNRDDFDAAHAVFDTANRDPTMTVNRGVMEILRKVSVGRCAAVSYNRQEVRDFVKDIERYEAMHSGGHMSPLEHVARPMTNYEYEHYFCQSELRWNEALDAFVPTGSYLHYCGNFQGWVQDRKMIPNEHDFSKS